MPKTIKPTIAQLESKLSDMVGLEELEDHLNLEEMTARVLWLESHIEEAQAEKDADDAAEEEDGDEEDSSDDE